MVKGIISTLIQHRTKSRASAPSQFWPLAIITLGGALALASPFFIPTTYATDSAAGNTDNITLSIDSQCSFITKGSASAADGNYLATGANGTEATFTDDNNTRVFNVFCNQTSGYTVTAYATDLDREGGNDTIAFVDYSGYASAKATNPGVAVWSAELVDADSGATFGTAASPNIIKHTDGVSDPNGDIFSVNYMAYIGKTTPAGTYSGTAVYALTANPLPDYEWTLVYNAGIAGDSVANLPTTQTGTANPADNVTTVVSSTTPSYTGYSFLGWDTSVNATKVVYVPDQEISISRQHTTLNLYAVWGSSTLANGNYMQAMTADSCAAIDKYSVTGLTYELVDIRDNHSYLVRKLEDGNCWMVQNLSLFARTAINTYNTDLNGTATESSSFINNWNNAISVTAGSSQWNGSKYVYQVYNGTYQANTKNTTVTENNTPTANTGSYYNFITATAGYNADADANGDQAGNSSICPKGWKLPTGGDSGQFKALYATGYSSNSGSFQAAMNINNAYPGYCNTGRCPYAVGNIRLWSSTIYDASNGYFLYANSGYVNPTDNSYKYLGFFVRCVLANPTN